MAIVGDLLHSRVLRSNILLLTALGADVWVCGPRTLMLPAVERFGVRATTSLDEALANADVVMLLRVQAESGCTGISFPPDASTSPRSD